MTRKRQQFSLAQVNRLLLGIALCLIWLTGRSHADSYRDALFDALNKMPTEAEAEVIENNI